MPSPSTAPPPPSAIATEASKHALMEDVFALCVGTLLISLGVALYKEAGLLTGGIAGVAFLVHYATGVGFGPAFFVLNLPFYWLAIRRMGYAFTVKTFCAVALLTLLSGVAPQLMTIAWIQPAYASVLGGVALGTGFLVLFRHRASLGGIGVFVLYLQQRFGWRAGKIQMGIDCAIVLCAFFVVDPTRIAWSILGAVVLNLILAVNHKAGRYIGF